MVLIIDWLLMWDWGMQEEWGQASLVQRLRAQDAQHRYFPPDFMIPYDILDMGRWVV